MEKWWSWIGSAMAIFAFVRSYLPRELTSQFHRLYTKLLAYFSNYVCTTVQEFQDGGAVNDLFASVQLYLSALPNPSSMKSLNAVLLKKSSKLALHMGKRESVQDTFQGVTLDWKFVISRQKPRAASAGPYAAWLQSPQQQEEEVRKFVLRIHRHHRSALLQPYLDHITERAKTMTRENKQRSLYTNISSSSVSRGNSWVPVPFKHPASFQTLALDSELKRSIIDDLTEFAEGGEFYKRAGRAWKRGYLLYGPPGTGKTTMIAAIANFLGYDVYDLELTQVKSNSELRALLLSTTDKSVIVIEDIDCSLDLSERSKKAEEVEDSKSDESKNKEVTLSGLLNFTDGILSCCSRERIIVFTTNHVEKLDPALLRSGRMDMHIHLSFCTFDGVRVLVRNYLQIEDHPLFPAIELAIASAKMSPAAVSEVLIMERQNPDAALQALLLALEESIKKQPPPLASQKEEEEEACGEKAEEEEIKGGVIVSKKVKNGEDTKTATVSEEA